MSGKIHVLKTDPFMLDTICAGEKTFELRQDDRGFKVGDTLVLRETVSSAAQMRDGAALEYTGRELPVTVTYILRGPVYGLKDGWVIMSIATSYSLPPRM